MARQGKARQGRGRARQGKGSARRGVAGQGHGASWPGEAGQGLARQGRGEAWRGKARQGRARTRRVLARQGEARQGLLVQKLYPTFIPKEKKVNEGLFVGGIPLDIEIGKLDKEFGVPEKDTLITYKEFEKVLKLRKRSNRFQSALRAWRKNLFIEHNLVSEADRGVGIAFLKDNARVDHVERGMKNSLRSVKRNHVKASRTPRENLNEVKIRELNHQINLSATIINLSKNMIKKHNLDRLKDKND